MVLLVLQLHMAKELRIMLNEENLNLFFFVILSWFQTMKLAALALRSIIILWRFKVAALSGDRALAISPSDIALKLNRSQLFVICRCGQSGEVIYLLVWRCLLFCLPSVASGACAVVLLSSSKQQCDKRQVSLKAALVKSHECTCLNGLCIMWSLYTCIIS